jgi:hypothetical protein
MNTTKFAMASIVTMAVFSIATASIAPSAFAEGSNGSFWGQASSELGQSGNMGSHSSSFDEPRTGLGNLKNTFNGDWCQLLGFLSFVCMF